MARVAANGMQLEYECLGSPDDPAMLLIMGLGAQLTRWPENFCRKLVEQGFYVIRYDHRDVGLSTHLDGAPVFDLASIARARQLGEPLALPYSLLDMARDAVGLLDALQIDAAHLVGASMGGMIAQLIAAEFPQRTRSLTSIMSTTGNPELPPPSPQAAALLTAKPAQNANFDTRVEEAMRAARLLASPFNLPDARLLRERVSAELQRSDDPQGRARQLAALIADGDRRPSLRQITAPTLVIHGVDDPLVPVAGGRDTAANIRGARLLELEGMGHDLPENLHERIVAAIAENAGAGRAAERAVGGSARA